MADLDRTLHDGPYAAPRFRLGQKIECAVRGTVKIVGISSGRIPWPIGQTLRAKSLVVFAGLENAVRTESNAAVAHWFGVTPQTVTKWREALAIQRVNKGTHELLSRLAFTPEKVAGRKKAQAKAGDPDRRAKIAAARRGKRMSAKVKEALRKANTGRSLSVEHRKMLSIAQRRRGARPPKAGSSGTAEEDRMLLVMPPAQAAAETGRSLTAVYSRREVLRSLGVVVEDGRTAAAKLSSSAR
jgi:hypothetical protein